MLLSLAAVALAEGPRPPCGSPATLASLALHHPRPTPAAHPGGVAPPSAEKEERDAFDTYSHDLEDDDFVVKWGPVGGVSEADAQALLDDFAGAWAAEIDG